jgi:L-rhamnose-H+ transport protein
MTASPLIGVLLHALGGLASASFYLPFRGVRRWSWETHWLAGGVWSWLVAPLTFAALLVPGFLEVLEAAPARSLGLVYLFGALWGLGGLSFGLTMRYLGIALGMAIALGYCAAFGTLLPPLVTGTLGPLVARPGGGVILAGVGLCLAGIATNGRAGMRKERELPEARKRASVREFAFGRGLAVATFSGIMSSCFSFGLAAGEPIAALAGAHLARTGGQDLWRNLPVLVVLLLGGFTTNLAWCALLHARKGSAREYLARVRATRAEEGPALERVPLLRNHALAAAAGLIWYMQYFFYGMGETRMGAYRFSSWTLHMATIVIFSTLWGLLLREWSGVGRRTRALVALGLLLLVLSTVLVGHGNATLARS